MEVPKTITKPLLVTIATAVILFGISWRLAPHQPNFAPIGAIALVASMVLGWRASIAVMVATLGISDYMLGPYPGMAWTWLGFVLIVAFGSLTKNLPVAWRIPTGAVGTSLLFFLVSNFGTWVASGMYSHTLTGLAECYYMALPFLRATFLSDLVFVATFISACEVGAAIYQKSSASARTCQLLLLKS